ncbi:hypothetical protein LEP1GSC165_0051 [Leptospira santarosai str. CBC523]|uniref:DUF4376 domain-containing protein n=1 Tax=Leptospira santarosai TaxID=28183 RepID=UPI0002BD5D5C|nr:hypothetical protein [Leptospira santarosai]EMO12460.1 hypothetical protein LEP1GSC165_0051 [Leptospira santarosai str. CBC523]
MIFLNLQTGEVIEESSEDTVIHGWRQMAQADPNLGVLEQWPIPKTKLLEGKLVAKLEDEWEIPFDISAEESRNRLLQKLKILFSEKCNDGISFEGEIFQTDEMSLNRIGLAIQDWGRGIETPYWIRRDNTRHQITSLEQLNNLATAIGTRWRVLFDIFSRVKSKITTLDENELTTFDLLAEWINTEQAVG